MNWDLVLSKAVNSAMVLGFFAAAVYFLRLLYGPGGRWRDPEWDRWNEEAENARLRQSGAAPQKKCEQGESATANTCPRESNERAEAACESEFLKYARGFFSGDAALDSHMQLKIDHSLRVLGHARELARSEESLKAEELRHPLILAALFHDVGRFEQLRRYGTFADDASCNHGLLGARVLREQGFLRAEAPETRRMVMALVALHNRPAVPENLPDKRRLLLYALRDADKLDILRVLAAQLAPGKKPDPVILMNVVDDPGACSPAIVKALETGRGALYRDMRFVNDFRVVLCTWLHDLHFAASLRLAAEGDMYKDILAGLEGVPDVRDKARALVEGKLGRKL